MATNLDTNLVVFTCRLGQDIIVPDHPWARNERGEPRYAYFTGVQNWTETEEHDRNATWAKVVLRGEVLRIATQRIKLATGDRVLVEGMLQNEKRPAPAKGWTLIVRATRITLLSQSRRNQGRPGLSPLLSDERTDHQVDPFP